MEKYLMRPSKRAKLDGESFESFDTISKKAQSTIEVQAVVHVNALNGTDNIM
jgi:hypothetical protein